MWLTARWLRVYFKDFSPKIQELIEQRIVWPEITIIVPACNEENTIVKTVESLKRLEYPKFRVLVVNDGSSDRTLEILEKEFGMKKVHTKARGVFSPTAIRGVFQSESFKQLFVLDKINTGKADSINCGLNYVETKLFAICDADVELDAQALEKLAEPFVRDGGNEVIAVGAPIRAISEKTLLTKIQALEYLRAFVGSRLNWNRWNDVFMISGALGLYSTEAALASSGIPVASQTEDLDFSFRLQIHHRRHNKKFKIIMIPDMICSSRVPTAWKSLIRQRFRWHRGLLETLFLHWYLFFNPKYGRLGLVTYPYLFFVELISPLVEWLVIVCLIIGAITGLVQLRFLFLIYFLAVIFNVLSDSLLMSYAKKYFPIWAREFKGSQAAKIFVFEGILYHFVISFVRLLALVPLKLKTDASWRAHHAIRMLVVCLLAGAGLGVANISAKAAESSFSTAKVENVITQIKSAEDLGLFTQLEFRNKKLDFGEYVLGLERTSRFGISDYRVTGSYIWQNIKKQNFGLDLGFSPGADLLPRATFGVFGSAPVFIKSSGIALEGSMQFKWHRFALDDVLLLVPGADLYYGKWLSSFRLYGVHVVKPQWSLLGAMFKQSYFWTDDSKISAYYSSNGELFFNPSVQEYQSTPVSVFGLDLEHFFKNNWGLGFTVEHLYRVGSVYSRWISMGTRVLVRF